MIDDDIEIIHLVGHLALAHGRPIEDKSANGALMALTYGLRNLAGAFPEIYLILENERAQSRQAGFRLGHRRNRMGRVELILMRASAGICNTSPSSTTGPEQLSVRLSVR